MTNQIKIFCRSGLVDSLYEYGCDLYKKESYSSAKENFEEALNILNSYYEVRDWYGNGIDKIKRKLGETLFKIAEEKWHNNINDMETAIDYLRQAKNLFDYLNDYRDYLSAAQIYYYLYKAYNESISNRTSNLDMARKCDYDPRTFFHYRGVFRTDGIGDINYLYNKSKSIDNIESQIGKKRSNMSNLNYELNSINNNINNIQSMINEKISVINNKNGAISELNNLTDSLISNGNEINNETIDIINNGKNQVEEIKENIQEKKEFVEEIAKLEKQKKEDIENMKNSNKALKQKNEQIMLMLTALELKLN